MMAKPRPESASLSPILKIWGSVFLDAQDTVMRTYYHQEIPLLGVTNVQASETEKGK